MKSFTVVREAAGNEAVALYRGLAVIGGILAGTTLALWLGGKIAWPLPAEQGLAGPVALGWVGAWQTWKALLLLLGAALGGGIGLGAWQLIAQLQCRIDPSLPVLAGLKRAALPSAAFLPLLTFLFEPRGQLFLPLLVCLEILLGILVLAFLERGDKRKIFVAHPTETDYHPSALFTHGGVVLLGAGLGWFLQSLPGRQGIPPWGLWFPAVVGIGVWILALNLAGLLRFLYTKHTFNQSFQAVALGFLPWALLPLQAAGWTHVAEGGKWVGGFEIRWLPVLLPVLAGLGGFTVFLLALLHLSRRPVEIQPAWEELFQGLLLIVGVPLFVFSAAFWPAGSPLGPNPLAGSIDLLREGESLASAQAVLLGRLPFKEIIFRHGFLSDAVTGLTALGWFGPTFESYRLLLVWLMPLGAVGLYVLSIFCLPWVWGLLLVLGVLGGHLGWVAETRYFLAYISFVFTLLYLQRERWLFLLISGLLTALAVIASFDGGGVALAGNGVLLLAYVLLPGVKWSKRCAGLGTYLGAAVLCLAPWWLYLALSGSLGAYFQNNAWAFTHMGAIFSLPVPGWGDHPSVGQILWVILPPLAVLLGTLQVAAALGKIRERGLPWNVLLLTTVTFLLWLRFLQSGQTAALWEALPVAAMLLAFFIFRLTAHNQRVKGIILGLALLAFFIPQTGRIDLPALVGTFGAKNVVPAQTLVKTSVGSLGQVFLPAAQAQALTELSKYLDEQVGSSEAYYDFSNQPLLYFLVPRRPVVKALTTAGLASFDQQVEAIRDLIAARIKAAIWPGPQNNGVDGILSEVRQYAISEFLLKNFVPVTVKGGSVMLAPREQALTPDPAAALAMQRSVDLQELPWQWGRLAKYDPNQGGVAGGFAPAAGAKSVEPAGVTVTAVGDALAAAPFAGEVKLHLAGKSAPAANVLYLGLKAEPELDGKQAVLSWGEKDSGRQIAFRIHGDQAAHAYVFRIGALPSWVLAGEVTALQLRLPGGGWTLEKTLLLTLHDLPEVAQPKPADAAPAAGKSPVKKSSK